MHLTPRVSYELTADQRKDLRAALIAAFPSQPRLELMVEDELGRSLNQITQGQSDYELSVRDLVKWAEAQGELCNLVVGASVKSPSGPILQSFVRRNLQALLAIGHNSAQNPFSSDLLASLIQCLETITDFVGIILPACTQTLPELNLNHPKLGENLSNDDLSTSVKWLDLLKLFLKYGKNSKGHLHIIVFVENLRSSSTLSSTPTAVALTDWLKRLPPEVQISQTATQLYANQPKPSDESLRNLQAYFLIIVEPPEITGQTDKFYVNGYLISRLNDDNQYTKFQSINLQDIFDEQQKKGLFCTLEQIEYNLPDWLVEAQATIQKQCQELKSSFGLDSYPIYELNVEFWLPFEYLAAAADTWRVYGQPVRRKQRNRIIGREHRVVVRSYDRFSDPESLNKLNRTWQTLNTFPEDLPDAATIRQTIRHVDSWKSLTDIQKKFVNQSLLGLTLACPLCSEQYQGERENLFAWILEAGIPMALWSRCSDLADLQEKMHELLTANIHPIARLLEQIKQIRKLADDNDKQHMGHNLAIWFDEPKRLIELKQFLTPGRLNT